MPETGWPWSLLTGQCLLQVVHNYVSSATFMLARDASFLEHNTGTRLVSYTGAALSRI